jgi:hypothetical protein
MLVAGQAIIAGLAVGAHLLDSAAMPVALVVVLVGATVMAALPPASRLS